MNSTPVEKPNVGKNPNAIRSKSVTVKLSGHSKSIKRFEYGVAVAPNLIASGARTASEVPFPPPEKVSAISENSLPIFAISCKSNFTSLLISNFVAGEAINPKSVTLKPARTHLLKSIIIPKSNPNPNGIPNPFFRGTFKSDQQ